MKAYTALIAGLEKENRIQSRLIEAQRTMIETLEAHNAELEKIISDLSSI
jgi:cell division protein FtsB